MRFKLLGILVLAGIAIQFIPYGKNHTNPPVMGEPQWDSPKTQALFTRVCANCHSHNTTWPWYGSIAPVSWLIQRDVDEARAHFNASMWGFQKMNKGRDAADEVQSGEMPPWFYVLGHPEAKLSEAEKTEFVAGLSATFKNGQASKKP